MILMATPKPQFYGPGETEQLAQMIGGTFGKLAGRLITYTIPKLGMPGGGGIKEAIDWITKPVEEMKKWFHQETGIPSLDPYQLAGRTAAEVTAGVGKAYFNAAYSLSPKDVRAILVVDRTKEFDVAGRNLPKYIFNKAWDWAVKGEIIETLSKVIGANAYEKIYFLPETAFDRAGNLIRQAKNYGAPDYGVFRIPKAAILSGEALQAAAAGRNVEASWKNFLAGASNVSLLAQSVWPGRIISGGFLKEIGYTTSFDTNFSARPAGWQQGSGHYVGYNGAIYHQRAVAHIDLRSGLPNKGDVTGWQVTAPREFRFFGGPRIDGVARFASDFLSVPGILDAVLTGNNLRKWAFVEWNSNLSHPVFNPTLNNTRSRWGIRVERGYPKFDKFRQVFDPVTGKTFVKRVFVRPQATHYKFVAPAAGRTAGLFLALEELRKAAPLILTVAGAVTANPVLLGAGLLKINEPLKLLDDLKYLGWVYNQQSLKFGTKDLRFIGGAARNIYLLTHPFTIDGDLKDFVNPAARFLKSSAGTVYKWGMAQTVVYSWLGSRQWYQNWLKFRSQQNWQFLHSPLGRVIIRAKLLWRRNILSAWDNSRIGRWISHVAWPALLNIYPIRLAYQAFHQHGIFGALGSIFGVLLLPLIGIYFTFSQINSVIQNIIQNQIIGGIIKTVGTLLNIFVWLPFRYLVWKIGGFLFKQFGWKWAGKLASWAFRSMAKDALAKFVLRILGGGIRQALLGVWRSILTSKLGTLVRWILNPRLILSAVRLTWMSLTTKFTNLITLPSKIWGVIQGAWAGIQGVISSLNAAAAGGGAGGAALTVILWIIIIAAIITIIVGIVMIVFTILIPLWFAFVAVPNRFYSGAENDYLRIEKTVPDFTRTYVAGDTVNYTVRFKVKKVLNNPVILQDYFRVEADEGGTTKYFFDPTSIYCSTSGGGLKQENDPKGPSGVYYRWGGNAPYGTLGDWNVFTCQAKVDSRYTDGHLYNHAIVIGEVSSSTHEQQIVTKELFLNLSVAEAPSGWPVSSACIFQGPLGGYSHTIYINQQAVDLADHGGARLGDPVYSTSTGIISAVQTVGGGSFGCGSAGFGNCVIVKSGEFEVIYAHLNTILSSINLGTPINKSEQIGTVGFSGLGDPNKTHIHYGFTTSSGKMLTTPYIPIDVPACSGLYEGEPDDCNVMLRANGQQECF